MASHRRCGKLGRTFAGAVLKQAIALTCLMLGVFVESALWDEHIMQSPDELTVTDFELAEEGFSVVLTNAIEDQRAVVENLAASHQARRHLFEKSVRGSVDRRILKDGVQLAAEMHFRAQRVLSLLEAAREREDGRLA